MKTNRLLILAAGLFLVLSCKDGFIDDITPAEAAADVTAPTVMINYPGNGALVRVREDVTPITIRVEVTDDVEIKSIDLKLDGTVIKSFTSFLDFRRAVESYTYPTLGNGAHTLTVVAKDLAGKETTASTNFQKAAPYQPIYTGEIFYMPFEGEYVELVSITTATKVGSPSFNDNGEVGKAYQGFTGGYITMPTTGLTNPEFTALFWYKVNASPDRSGILTMGPPDPALPATPNNRKNGFRLFRENAGGKQRIKLNVGTGATDNWFDGGAAADIDPAAGTWAHIAFTISGTKAVVYINGAIVSQGNFPAGTTVSWTGCDVLSIASGAPRFTEWGHMSDNSLYDELRIFNKALTQAEIQDIMND